MGAFSWGEIRSWSSWLMWLHAPAVFAFSGRGQPFVSRRYDSPAQPSRGGSSRVDDGSLDTIAKHLGVGAKNGSGADFAALWQSDRAKAADYLRNDLQLTAQVAEALGVMA